MLTFNLVASSIVVVCVLANALISRNLNLFFWVFAVPMGIACTLRVILVPVFLQGIFITLALLTSKPAERRFSTLFAHYCIATTAAFGLPGLVAASSMIEYARLRQLYPYESMASRVPLPRPMPGGVVLSPDAEARLAWMEDTYAEPRSRRNGQLQRLHEDFSVLFAESPAFGIVFVPHEPVPRRSDRGQLDIETQRGPVPDQPGREGLRDGDWADLTPEETATFNEMLNSHIRNFVDPRSTGYYRDREHVAGFVSHRFDGHGWETSAAPAPGRLQRLELMGLLLHDEPVVYESAKLPALDARRDHPTRPLDRFESAALLRLEGGDDLVAARIEGGLRVVGALRNAKGCTVCHGGERGELLGAFSYGLDVDADPTNPFP